MGTYNTYPQTSHKPRYDYEHASPLWWEQFYEMEARVAKITGGTPRYAPVFTQERPLKVAGTKAARYKLKTTPLDLRPGTPALVNGTSALIWINHTGKPIIRVGKRIVVKVEHVMAPWQVADVLNLNPLTLTVR